MKAPIIRRQISEALTKDATVLNRTGSRGSVPKSVVTLEVLETERSMSKTLLISFCSLSSLGRQSGNFAPRQILKAWKWIVNCLIRQRPIKSYSLKKLIRQLRGKKYQFGIIFRKTIFPMRGNSSSIDPAAANSLPDEGILDTTYIEVFMYIKRNLSWIFLLNYVWADRRRYHVGQSQHEISIS